MTSSGTSGPAADTPSSGVLLVAHRGGNRCESARRLIGRVDLIELDVHVRRGRVEVRHEKLLRPTSLLWERWHILPRGTPVPTIDEIIAVVDPDTELLVDLKCFTARAARRIRGSLPPEQPITVASRSWWVLRAFRDRPRTRVLRSCRSWWQLHLARILPGLSEQVGVVAHESLLRPATIDPILARTPHLFCWGVTDPRRGHELAVAGVSALIVDDIEMAGLTAPGGGEEAPDD
ncbi:MAG: glycerophosphodiester phosphodiesterase [Acidimicrobiales bacterium]